jgi:hypothetical protein
MIRIACQTGYVIGLQPPKSLVLAWQINAEWQKLYKEGSMMRDINKLAICSAVSILAWTASQRATRYPQPLS